MRPNGDRRAAVGGTGSAVDFLPARRMLPALRAAAADRRARGEFGHDLQVAAEFADAPERVGPTG